MRNETTPKTTPEQTDGLLRSIRAMADRITVLAHKHEVERWKDAPGTDAEKLAKILTEAREILFVIDEARA